MHLPSLRERGEDIMLLVQHFLHEFCARKKRPVLVIPPLVQRILEAYPWPGNVRELENLAERLSILCDGQTITPEDLPAKILAQVGDLGALPERAPRAEKTVMAAPIAGFTWPTVADLREKSLGLKEFFDIAEEKLLLEALQLAGGVKNQAAEILGIKRTTLIEKLKKRNME